MTPLRIQRKRTKGWRMPENTVCVTRPGPFGNPYRVSAAREASYEGTDDELNAMCVRFFANAITKRLTIAGKILDHIYELRGKNLACWCKLCPEHAAGKPFALDCPACAPCHADVLGRMCEAL